MRGKNTHTHTHKWRNEIPKKRRKKGEKDVERDKGKGREGKTNVRHTLYFTGLRKTPNTMVSYREQQFSLQLFQERVN